MLTDFARVLGENIRNVLKQVYEKWNVDDKAEKVDKMVYELYGLSEE